MDKCIISPCSWPKLQNASCGIKINFIVMTHNNDEQYIESRKRDQERERDTDLTWFGNLPTFTERRLLFS
jgi:hypothetical protein